MVETPVPKDITQALMKLDKIQADIRNRPNVSESAVQPISVVQPRAETSAVPSLRERRSYFVR